MDYIATTDVLVLLFFVALLSGFVDSVAGGGGLISIPALLAVGVPPHIAIGTNKMQACFGSFAATVRFTQIGLVQPHKLISGIVATAVGGVIGAIVVQAIPDACLCEFIPIVLLVIFVYAISRKHLGESDRHHKMRPSFFYPLFGFAFGFYDGFFGPGTGSFWMISLVTILGLNLKKATANTRVMNFTSNLLAFITFVSVGQVAFSIGAAMAIGQIIGAVLGAHTVVRCSVRFIRIFFLTIVGLTLLKVTWSSYF